MNFLAMTTTEVGIYKRKKEDLVFFSWWGSCSLSFFSWSRSFFLSLFLNLTFFLVESVFYFFFLKIFLLQTPDFDTFRTSRDSSHKIVEITNFHKGNDNQCQEFKQMLQ